MSFVRRSLLAAFESSSFVVSAARSLSSFSRSLSLARSLFYLSLSLSLCQAEIANNVLLHTLPTFAVSRLAPSSTKMAPREAAAAAAASSSRDIGGARPPTIVIYLLSALLSGDVQLAGDAERERCLVSASESGERRNLAAGTRKKKNKQRDVKFFAFVFFFFPSESLFFVLHDFLDREKKGR